MKLSKRLLSVLMSLIMIISVFGFSAFAEDVPDVEWNEEGYNYALKTLQAIGIIPDGYDDYKALVSYGEFATYTGVFMTGDPDFQVENAWNTAGIDLDANLTINDALKMIIDISPYHQSLAQAKGGFPRGYRAVAAQLELLGKISDTESNLRFGNAVQILYSMLNAEIPEETISTNGQGFNLANKATALEHFFGIEIREGFATANRFWSLTETTLPDSGLVINGIRYDLKYPDDDDYVGNYVTYYYHPDNEMVLSVVPKKSQEILHINSSDIVSYKAGVYEYEDGNAKRRATLSSNAYILTNYTPTLISSAQMVPTNGEVVLIDNNGDGKFDVANVKKQADILVNGFSFGTDVEYISGANNTRYAADTRKYPIQVYLGTARLGVSSVSNGMVASVVVDKNNICREIILFESSMLNTKVQGFSSEGGVIESIMLDGVEYAVSQGFTSETPIKLGVAYNFYLNYKDEIAYATNVAQSGSQFGYLINIGERGSLKTVIEAKILNQKGEVKIYEFAEKCKINNEKETNDDIMALFKPDGVISQQLIYFTTNSDEKVTNIEIPLPNGDSLTTSDYRLYESHNPSSTGIAPFIGSDTVKFKVPAVYSDNDLNYMLTKETSTDALPNLHTYNFRKNDAIAHAIVSKNTRLLDDGICGGPGPTISQGGSINNFHMYIVTKAVTTMAYDGQVELRKVNVTNTVTGAASSYLVADNAEWQYYSGNYKYVVQEYTKGERQLNKGDILQLTLNDRGEIGSINKLYDANARAFMAGKLTDGTSFNYGRTPWESNIFTLAFGYVVSADRGGITIASDVSDIEGLSREQLMFTRATSNLWFIDEEFNVRKGTATELQTAMNSATPSYVLAHSHYYNNVKSVIVMEYR